MWAWKQRGELSTPHLCQSSPQPFGLLPHVLTHRLMTTCQVCQLWHLLLRFPLTTLKQAHTEQENIQMHENTLTNMYCFYIWWKQQNTPLYGVTEEIPSNSPIREIMPCPLSGLFTSLFPSKGVSIVLQKGSKECWQKLSIWHILAVFAAFCTQNNI